MERGIQKDDALEEFTVIHPAVPPNLTADSIYEFYSKNLLPAIWASLPLLVSRLRDDLQSGLQVAWMKTLHFLIPWSGDDNKWSAPSLVALWENALENSSNSTVAEFMLRHFDTNQDGHISTSELLNMTEIMSSLRRPHSETWIAWFSRAWPLMDWKFGVFIWRYCGGLLLVVAIATLVPGRLHGYSGRILRWPILGLTYFMIAVELLVYVIIRLFIKLVETVFANSKHRKLRRTMATATSYDEWYALAKALDISQGRDKWQLSTDDDTSHRYNWSFVKELMRDMRSARQQRDSLLALAVLQQCTRKNVGGVMSEEIFSYTNTGEPKHIVREFVEEVAITLKWVTDEALKTSNEADGDRSAEAVAQAMQAYEKKFQQKVMQEKNKMWSSLLSWATLNFGDDHNKNKVTNGVQGNDRGIPVVVSADRLSGKFDDASHDSGPRKLPAFHREQLIAFLKRARAAYGRSALCLSGGAMMGNYHFGHVKALLEVDALPNIISGTSAGSVVGSIVCTRTDDEIQRDLRPEVLADKLKCFSRPWPDRVRSLLKNGHLFDYDEWLEMIKWMTCGDLTFDEAYKKTGRVFCITLSATTKKAPPVLLNHISAPNVLIASAIIASAAVPGFIPPVRLQVKGPDGKVRRQAENKDQLYWDGSIEQDIPTSGLAEMLNCQFFIAAQCNPHIVPFFYNSKGDVGRPSRWSSGMRADSWRGGFLLSALELYLKSDMRAKFHFLNDLEAAIGFTSTLMTQQYGGTTTIVPQVSLIDYFRLFSNPTLWDLKRYFQGGSVAAYQHCAIIKLHYHIADALDECLLRLENGPSTPSSMGIKSARLLAQKTKTIGVLDGDLKRRHSIPSNIQLSRNERVSGGYLSRSNSSETSASVDDEFQASSVGIVEGYSAMKKF